MIDAIGAFGARSGDEAPLLLEQALLGRTKMISRKPRIYDSFEECMARWSESFYAPRGEENLRLIVSRGTEEIFDPINFISGFRFRHDPKLKAIVPMRISREASQAFLKRVACPVVAVLANDRDPFWPEELEKIHMDLLRAKIFRVKGGHHCHMTNVNETFDCIMTMLADFKVKAKL
jgi:hypothetical protein